MKSLIIGCFLIIFFSYCEQDGNVEIGRSSHPINMELKRQAKDIFRDKLESERSYQSFSSNDVVYKINVKNLSMEEFITYKDQILPKKKWIFRSKINEGYIFCQGSRQLEIIPPQVLVGNNELGRGDIGKQFKNNWNIFLRHTANGTLNECYVRVRN
ncbi:hypothetical protein KTJ32_19490 [Acinetobacter gyllenbergii]|uniref:hypothetical protein n=1 Tax=Acinetobacter gyllenbergii TaxID=134534 RepID=UPI0021CF8C41|nr:hypothetical protein [Acinetobacter gyllenbergii]MCU4583180.1 hypothetical protein [Acinetobacter gyllenbergii]